MDELFWGRDHEDVNDWAERLTMAAEVRNLNANKLFKIAKLNLRGRAKEWFKRLQLVPADWAELRTLIVQKYGNVDTDDIRVKLDAIKQEPKERVLKYFEHLNKLFQRGRIPNVEQRRRFLGSDALPSHGVKHTRGFHKAKLRKVELGSTLPASNSRKG
jgi:hypothetical protein